MYKIIRFFLFCLPPETAHKVALTGLNLLYRCGLLKLFISKPINSPLTCFGIRFSNPIGIAAGLDKNGDYIDCLAALGVGFIEVGAVTPKPQAGNPKPRLFRIPAKQALINAMGFNNEGVDYLVNNLKRRKSHCVLGVNLGKNKQTPLAEAASDYNYCLEKIYPYADFATINISSPNTPNLRDLQGEAHLKTLLLSILSKRDSLSKQLNKRLPLLVKISPDLTQSQVEELAKIVTELNIDGIIATNTSMQRITVTESKHADRPGGLSGKPIAQLSYQVLTWLSSTNKQTFDIISVGGIDSSEEVIRRLNNGAKLVQLYSGLIYQGPCLIKKLLLNVQRLNKK